MSVKDLWLAVPVSGSLLSFPVFLYSATWRSWSLISPFPCNLPPAHLLPWRHLGKVQLSATGWTDASTTELTMFADCDCFLGVYFIFFLSLLQVWSSKLLENILSITVCQVFALAYPSGHLCLLILRKNKLSQVYGGWRAGSKMLNPLLHKWHRRLMCLLERKMSLWGILVIVLLFVNLWIFQKYVWNNYYPNILHHQICGSVYIKIFIHRSVWIQLLKYVNFI